jgi:hypothetical protein
LDARGREREIAPSWFLYAVDFQDRFVGPYSSVYGIQLRSNPIPYEAYKNEAQYDEKGRDNPLNQFQQRSAMSRLELALS